ncbi:unknown [Crocosphaera subtropica ATCC 51142]|uniref:Lipoprotein n=1 Tax=Crocosphaera subtropica (strain ATCC 51142 / BH68) TaxID=43989 RepID=B1WT62_CROS5|nr:hypothetical protein [Crocosphaera subtropica]ACB51984.1 unknown [Crocosphaera subtropica ATCC 51142]
MKKISYLSFLFLVPFAVTLTSCSTPSENKDTTQTSAPEVVETKTEEGDTDYLTSLGLMKGHLMVAKDLMEQGKYEEAEPHVGHPVEELYGTIEPELSKRNVTDFKMTLNQFHDGIKTNPKSEKMKELYENSMTAIDQAIAAVPTEKLQSPETVLPVINGLLATANAEYQAAIANNKFVELIEYQDSMGFVAYAEEIYQPIADTMSQQYPEKHEVITTSLAELKTAWPSVNAPETPVMSPEKVNELVTKIQESSTL